MDIYLARSPKHPNVAIILSALGHAHYKIASLAQAKDYWENTIAIYEDRGDEDEVQVLRENIANLESEQPID